jgi:hypothetical protein
MSKKFFSLASAKPQNLFFHFVSKYQILFQKAYLATDPDLRIRFSTLHSENHLYPEYLFDGDWREGHVH